MKLDNKQNKIHCDTDTGICAPEDQAIQEGVRQITTNDNKPKLVYYYDALCGWCYGFSPVLKKVYEAYADKLQIEVISGGLFTGNRTGRINEIAPYIRDGAYKSVENTTGVSFGENFLSDLFGEGNIVLNSSKPSIALCIIKEKFPEKALEFAELLLKAVYNDGINPDDTLSLADYAVQIGYERLEFITNMESDTFRKAAKKEFELFQNSQHRGMPALVLEKDGVEQTIAYGYSTFEKIKSRLDAVLY